MTDKPTNGNNFITWKRVALVSFAIIGGLIVFGGQAMVSVSAQHITKEEAPAIIRSEMQPLTDQVTINGNRLTALESEKMAVRRELEQINAKLDRLLERR